MRMTSKMCRRTSCWAVGALVLGLAWTANALAEEPADKSSSSDQGVQERAVPRGNMMAPRQPGLKGGPVGPTPTMEGVVIQGNKITALPGYTLQPGPNNTISARRIGGGTVGAGAIPGCSCVGGDGTCTVSSTGTSGSCYKASGNTCSGTCGWSSFSSGGGVIAR